MFKIITVAIVICIIALFGVGAYKAEKIIDARAKAARDEQATKVSAKASKQSKAPKKKSK